MNAIEIKGLTKKYSDFKLEKLDLELPEGCIMGLIGENGAGKSTTIKSLLGIVNPDGGEISLLGKNSGTEVKSEIGVVLDDVGLPECLNITDVRKIMRSTYKNWKDDVFSGYIKRFDLPEKKSFKDFSKGMKMKLGIAIALSHDAKLLILDEPTSGLDPLVRDQVVDILNEYTRDEGHSILISSHIVSDLEKICDYIAFLHKGKLMLCEEKDRLLEQYAFVNVSKEQLSSFMEGAVKGSKESRWGVEAIVDRDMIPAGIETKPVNIEDLFVFMAQEEK